jgi:hypothetical protein
MEKDIALYREKLQRYYTTGGKLAQYPQKRPMRILALSRIAQRFEPARQYAEKEVNEIIQGAIAFPDVELVRRELYEYRFLDRRRDGSAYWPEDNWREAYGSYLETA